MCSKVDAAAQTGSTGGAVGAAAVVAGSVGSVDSQIVATQPAASEAGRGGRRRHDSAGRFGVGADGNVIGA